MAAEVGMRVAHRRYVPYSHAHYAGDLVDGAYSLGLFGDVATEMCIRTDGDEVFALDDRCPHKGGPLSQGIVHNKSVTCPLHNFVIDLATGRAVAPDEGCAHSHPVKVENGIVWLSARQTAAA